MNSRKTRTALRSAFARFDRTGRLNETLLEHYDKDTLKVFIEIREFSKRVEAGEVSNAEIRRFIGRILRMGLHAIDANS